MGDVLKFPTGLHRYTFGGLVEIDGQRKPFLISAVAKDATHAKWMMTAQHPELFDKGTRMRIIACRWRKDT